MKSKHALGLIITAVLVTVSLTGCKKNDENNSEQVEGEVIEEMTNSQLSAAILNTDIEKSDLVADEKVYEEVVKINAAAWKYYNEKFKEASFISNCGYLYSLQTGKEVTMDDLVSGGYYTCPEGMDKLMGTDINLFMPKDVIDRGVDVMDAAFACLYTSLRTTEGVFVSSPEDKGGMMSYENYRNLLIDYVPEHGDIVYPKKKDENYNQIISAINDKEGAALNLDVKYMVCDDEYAVAVVGNKDEITEIKEYVLTKSDGKWAVDPKGAGLEKSKDNVTAINVNFPKISSNMIPPFNLGSNNPIRTDLSRYIESLKGLGLVEENDLPATYQCGVGRFIYLEFKSGKKIAGGAGEDKNLKCITVNNAAEAVKYMHTFDGKAPIYIINMDF